jgi:hypothetical protein
MSNCVSKVQEDYDIAMWAMLPLLNKEAKKYKLHVTLYSSDSVYRVEDQYLVLLYVGCTQGVLNFINDYGHSYYDNER